MSAQQGGLADEVLVLIDAEVRFHGGPDDARLINQIRDPPDAQAQRPIDVIHLDDELLDVATAAGRGVCISRGIRCADPAPAG